MKVSSSSSVGVFAVESTRDFRFGPGAVIADRYEIRSVIGSGGMGDVYLVHDLKVREDVALKTLNREFVSNRNAAARFEREVKLARRLHHPGIIKLYETHDWNGVLFYTMEYVEGRTLRCWLREGQRPDLATTVRMLCLVCDVLEHVHKITIHRDLSPENIMVLPDGSVRLLDFGLAKLDDEFKGLTATGSNLGKLMYMAPEQELDASRVDRRADLYSLGVIFFEMLVGCTPRSGQKVTELRPELPPETEKFVRKALARKPEERFSSAREFREALRRLCGPQETRAHRADIFVSSRAILKQLFRTIAQNGRLKRGSPEIKTAPWLQRADAEISEPFETSDADSICRSFFQVSDDVTDGHRLRESQKRLAAVYAANQAIAGERELSCVFDRILDQVFLLLPADTGVILLKGENGGDPQVEYVRSKSGSKSAQISMTIVRRAFERGEAIITHNALADSRFSGVSIMEGSILSAMCVPLTHHGDRLGVIYVDRRRVTDAFKNSDLELLAALAGAAATAIKNTQYMHTVEQSYQETLLVLADAIEMRDRYTVGHAWRVTNFAVEIARELAWDEAKLKEVHMGGMLHDVGKIAVDNAILGKTEPLTDEEYSQMKVHPERGASLLRDAKCLQPVVPYCLYHHERWDGTGYPYELKGEEIPIEGRLMAVADTFDAMTSNRPYREGLDPSKAIQTILEGRGAQFDPAIVDALVACHEKGRMEAVLKEYQKNGMRSIVCPFCRTPVHPRAEVAVGDETSCPVCQRRVRIMEEACCYGEQVLQTSKTQSPVISIV